MNRPILVCALLLTVTAALGVQGASQSNPYEGTSTPPSDDTITTSSAPDVKPPAARPAVPAQDQTQAQPQDQAQPQASSQPATSKPAVNAAEA